MNEAVAEETITPEATPETVVPEVTQNDTPPSESLLASTEVENSPNFTVDPSAIADPSKAPAPIERPKNIPKQFWDEKKGELNSEAMATSYNDLRKQFNKMTQENGTVPEDFDAYLEDFKVPMRSRANGDQAEGDILDRLPNLDAKDPIFTGLAKAAKNANLSKGQFDDLMPDFMKVINDMMPEKFDPQKEMALLGENGEHMVKVNTEWINRLASRGVLNENQYNLLLKFGGTAEGVLLTNALRMDNGEKPIPVKASVATGRKTPDECSAMLDNPLFHKDGPEGDTFRAEVEKQFALTHGTEPA